MTGTLTIGQLAAFFSYIWFIVHPLQQLGYQINNLTQSDRFGAAPVGNFGHTPGNPRRPGRGRHRHDRRATSSLKTCRFQLHGKASRRSSEINLDVPPGNVVGILGADGCGQVDAWSA